jgi:hypothetical protein
MAFAGKEGPMSEERLEGKAEATSKDNLHNLSLEVQSFGEALQRLYDQATSKELPALDKLKDSVSQLQRRVGELRTQQLEGSAESLNTARQHLDEQRQKLDGIVDVINGVNEILDIATQIAQIAAGLMV